MKLINILKGFKGFDKDLKCRDMQYKVGEEFSIPSDKELNVCPNNSKEAGLHYCKEPFDVFGFYPPSTSRYCIVEGMDVMDKFERDGKVSSKRIKIEAEVSLSNFIKLGVDIILSKIDKSKKQTISKDDSAATNTGDYSAATNTGYKSAATNTGDYSAATVEGKQSIAANFGIEGKARGKKSCWIVLTEWKQEKDYSWVIIEVKSFKVDGKKIKEDIFYTLKDGKPIEVK